MLVGLLCQHGKASDPGGDIRRDGPVRLGGCWWPIEIVPETFKTIAMLTPSYWAMHGLQSVLYFGRSYETVLVECAVLLGFAILFALAAMGAARLVAKRPETASG